MTIDIGRFGIWRRVSEIDAAIAAEAEDLGYGAIWIGGSPSGDLNVVEAILDATRRIPVATGIVNMWREAAKNVAASFHRVEQKHADRFMLGVGIGHPESTAEYSDPLSKIDEYLDELDQAGVPRERLILAALGPKVLEIARERTAGAHPYLTTPRHTRLARQVLGEGPLLAPEHFVVVGDDDAARDPSVQMVSRYLRLGNYGRNLVREGWEPSDLEDGGSERLRSALVLRGTPELIGAGLRAHLDAGADHVGVQVIAGDVRAAHRGLAAALFD